RARGGDAAATLHPGSRILREHTDVDETLVAEDGDRRVDRTVDVLLAGADVGRGDRAGALAVAGDRDGQRVGVGPRDDVRGGGWRDGERDVGACGPESGHALG